MFTNLDQAVAAMRRGAMVLLQDAFLYRRKPRISRSNCERFATAVEQLSDSIPGAVLAYGSVEEWVGRYLLVMYRRAVSGTGTTWCPQWWRHPEAVVRLEALWRAWEYLRKDPMTGMSVWLRDHCDPHMMQLLSADGPFKGCKPKQHSGHPTDPLPCDRSPGDWFAQTDEGDLLVAAVRPGR